MKKKIFTGSGVAIVTPMKGERAETVDYDMLGTLIEFQIENGTDAIIICGTTGEASSMPDDEHLAVIEYAVKKVAGRVPVVAGTGSNDTIHAIKLSQKAEALGADALLSVTPYYNKTSQRGLVAHFTAIANSVKIPIVLYNVPSRTGVNLAPATIAELAKIDNINAVKECNLLQVPEVKRLCGDNINIYSGEDGQVAFLLGAGGSGVISVLANVAPRYTHDLCQAYFDGQPEKCWKMQTDVLPLVNALFSDVNPIPVKAAVSMLGYECGHVRMPLVDMSTEGKAALAKAMQDFGLI
ncbi:MAG: 4-hydroxy-tetrahydrodipicolinate synthase [Ruminococcaceae bacterium]|nr:4-hydroxy-tetrahydrodipicolinate synthase [Oscillospiraceae bacterium]